MYIYGVDSVIFCCVINKVWSPYHLKYFYFHIKLVFRCIMMIIFVTFKFMAV